MNAQPVSRDRFLIIGTVAALLLLSLALQATPEDLQAMLRYERSAIEAGEWWRLLTAHLVHLNWTHFTLNMLGLLLLVALFLRELTGKVLLMALICGALMVSLGLLLFSPEVEWYVGMSGMLHGLLAACLIRTIPHAPRLGLVLLALLVGKLLVEQVTGAPSSAIIGESIQVIGVAHIYGALGGAVIGAVALLAEMIGKRAG